MNPQETVPQNVTPQSVAPSPIKIGKFKASKMIVLESWDVLRQDKELAWFPIMSGVTSVILFIIFGAIYIFGVMGGDLNAVAEVDNSPTSGASYILAFLYYFMMFLITNYFLAGMYIIINGRFNGQNLSLNDGLNGAKENFDKIVIWSLISATVGLILQIIADRSKVIGAIVAGLLGAAWNILTYFSLPSLIIGKTSVKDSFKDSASIIRKTWGETIIINFGVGLFSGLLIFLGIVVAFLLILLSPAPIISTIIVVAAVLYIISVTIITATLGAIFKLALYHYAKTGNIPQGFTPALIQNAVSPNV